MKTLLRLGYATAFVALAHPAMAIDSDGIGLTTTLAAACTITTPLSATETISPPYPGEHNLGTMGYTCNFGNDLQFPSLKITAPGGTFMVNTTDSHAVQYEVKWTVPLTGPTMTYQTALVTTTFPPFAGQQGPIANVEQTGSVMINLLGDLTHAGTYEDVLIFAVSPERNAQRGPLPALSESVEKWAKHDIAMHVTRD